MFSKYSITTFILVAAFTTAAHSASFTYGTTTSIFTNDAGSRSEWLHINQTVGLSYDYVSSQLVVGGLYAGYGHASRQEVGALTMSLFGWDWSSLEPGVKQEYAVYPTEAVSFFNYTNIYENGDLYIGGITSDVVGNAGGFDLLGTLVAQEISNWFGYPAAAMDNTGPRFSSEIPNIEGHFLVRDVTTVPVPATIFLFGSGLLGLIGFAKRKV